MSDEDNIIDVEAVEIIDTPNLPALVDREGTDTRERPIEAESSTTVDGRDWPHGPTPERRCVAHRKNGDRCKNAAIKGATVCRYHGGAAPHVKAAARARLENATDLMARQLLGIAITAENEAVKLAAIKDALDRGGLKPPTTVEIGPTKPYEEVMGDVFEGISPMSRAESRRARGLPDEDSSWPAAEYAEGVGGLPPTQLNPDLPNRPDDQQARRQSLDPTTNQREPDHQSHSAGDVTSMQTGERRSADADVPPRAARRPQVPHITGDDAIRLANQANRAIGAFPEPKALPSAHKKYPRP